MPELPEVETVRLGLEGPLLGKRIARVQVNRPDLRWPFPEKMAERIAGARILNTSRRGKFILVELTSGETLIVHLGMTGGFRISNASRAASSEEAIKHEHLVFHTDCNIRVGYVDPRRFGMMDLVRSDAVETHRLLEGLGPEPLGDKFNAESLCQALKGRSIPVKSALLDQRIVAGIGNIYACEALWLAGISPQARAGEASVRAGCLVKAVKSVLSEAIEAGGSSLRDFRGVDGEPGYFQHDFKVYSRYGELCLKEDCSGSITKIVQSGRSTYYCEACQH